MSGDELESILTGFSGAVRSLVGNASMFLGQISMVMSVAAAGGALGCICASEPVPGCKETEIVEAHKIV